MAKALSFFLFILILAGCKKNSDQDDSTDKKDFTVTPGPEPLSTNIIGFITDDNNQMPIPSNVVFINNTSFKISEDDATFNTGLLLADKYATKALLGVNGNYFQTYKTFPVTPSMINFVNLKAAKPVSLGRVVTKTGGTFTFPNGGSINIPPDKLYETPYTGGIGFYDPNASSGVYAICLDPTTKDFAVRLPCYSFGDDNQKRSFLKSFGVAFLKINAYSPHATGKMDLNNTRATLKLPIPAGLISIAPDTIDRWVLNEGLWQKDGLAKKVSNFYESEISSIATYNFASAVNGVYKTIRLRTDSGSALMNATVRIKNSMTVLAESQTDVDGNALCFVPSNEKLTIEILNTTEAGAISQPIYTTAIPIDKLSSSIDITLPTTAMSTISTFKGTAHNCDGTPIQNGLATVTISTYPKKVLYIPIQNGKYNGSLITSIGDFLTLLKIKNLSTNVESSDTAILSAGGNQYNFTLNTCPPSTDLYMNYSIDNTSYSITGDMSHPDVPFLHAYPSLPGATSKTLITTNNALGQGLQFETYAASPGTFIGSGIYIIFIDGVYYRHNNNKPMSVTFSRYDLVKNGFIIGSADFYYYDKSDISHHIVAKFKLKRG